MKRLLWLAAVAALGCSTNVRQAPSAGLPEPRPAKQYQGDFEYPPPPGDEDLNLDKYGFQQSYEFKVAIESWPGTWLQIEEGKEKLVYVELESGCQLVLLFEFRQKRSAESMATELHDEVFGPRFDKVSPVRLSSDGSQAEFLMLNLDPPRVGHFVVRTFYAKAPGLVANHLLMCPGTDLDVLQRLSPNIVDSVSVTEST